MTPKITFITRHYPPSANINGESVCDMAQFLLEEYNIESNIICIDKDSDGGGQRREPIGNVIRLKSLFKNQKSFFRFFTFLYDGFILCREALKFKDSLIICTTSPPLLPFWASMLFPKKTKWALWSLDLFPEGFAATGKISQTNAFYQFVKKKSYQGNPNFLITLGHQQAKHLNQEYQKDIPHTILPCGVFFYQEKSKIIPDWWESDKIMLGYCGNVGDAHNAEFIRCAIDHVDPKVQKLILVLYGVKSQELKAYAKGKEGVVLLNNVPRNQLHFIDIHLVTLLKSWTHIAVPSKAVSAVSLGSSILFCGDKRSDNWDLLQNAGWFIDDNANLSKQVADFLKTVNKEAIQEKKKQAIEINSKLKKYISNTYKYIAESIE